MSDPKLFIPHALTKPPTVSETRLTRDLTMPPIDVAKYDVPAWVRLKREVKL